MMEMMKGYRNGLVGNYYEPQRIDYSDAIITLECTYQATTSLKRYASYEDIAKMAEKLEGGNYDE